MEFLAETVGLLDSDHAVMTLQVTSSSHDGLLEAGPTVSHTSLHEKVQDSDDVLSGNSITRNRPEKSILAKQVVKKVGINGDLFSGLADAVTGEIIHGRLTYSRNGDIYDGPFLQGRRHGDGGILTKLDGSKFLGSFCNDHPHEGTLVTPQFTYQGQLLLPNNDFSPVADESTAQNLPSYLQASLIFHGQNATLVQETGDVYEGDFSHGRFHGQGRERTASGLDYSGTFRSGKWHGTGELIFKRAGSKEGDNDSGMPPLEYSYSGAWQHGEREGRGTEAVVFGSHGLNDGLLVQGQPPTKSDDDDRPTPLLRRAHFVGHFHRDRRNGPGRLITPDGTIVQGHWKNGLPSTQPEDNSTICDRWNIATSLSNGSKGTSSQDHSKGRPAAQPINPIVAGDGVSAMKLEGLSTRGGRRMLRQRPLWKITYPNGNIYNGNTTYLPLQNDDPNLGHLHIPSSSQPPVTPHGQGTMAYRHKNEFYIGQFRLGKRHGYGRCEYKSSGKAYEGVWVDDCPGEVGGGSGITLRGESKMGTHENRLLRHLHKLNTTPACPVGGMENKLDNRSDGENTVDKDSWEIAVVPPGLNKMKKRNSTDSGSAMSTSTPSTAQSDISASSGSLDGKPIQQSSSTIMELADAHGSKTGSADISDLVAKIKT